MNLEKVAERKFVHDVKAHLGLRAIKFEDPSQRGAPDRLVLLPGGRCVFIEFKRHGQSLREEQEGYHDSLRALGHEVHTCYDAGEAYRIVKKLMEEIK